jgi:hypothetical protein
MKMMIYHSNILSKELSHFFAKSFAVCKYCLSLQSRTVLKTIKMKTKEEQIKIFQETENNLRAELITMLKHAKLLIQSDIPEGYKAYVRPNAGGFELGLCGADDNKILFGSNFDVYYRTTFGDQPRKLEISSASCGSFNPLDIAPAFRMMTAANFLRNWDNLLELVQSQTKAYAEFEENCREVWAKRIEDK